MPDRRLLGMALRDIREMRGLKQKELATKAEVSRGTIVGHEKGKKIDYKFSQVLDVLGVQEELLWQLAQVLEAVEKLLEQKQPGASLFDLLLAERALEQQSTYAQAQESKSSLLAESALVPAASIPDGEQTEKVVAAGAEFLRAFLQLRTAGSTSKPTL